MNVLAGDIGGTNARLALVALEAGSARIRHARTYESRRYPGLGPAVREFLSEYPGSPDSARFAVAGPVENDVALLPNLGWTVDASVLATETGIADTHLLNDFGAVGHAVAVLGADDFVELQPGRPAARAPVAILGAGTGLGQAFLVWTGARYQVCASEGGHADFAARDETECVLRDWLQERYGHASWERVLSGNGLADLYRFLAESGHAQESPVLRAAMGRGDAAALVARYGLAGDDPLSVEALARFVSIYGAQAGNLALTLRAGSVYLAGGIAPKILPALQDGQCGFLDAFHAKGRFATLMESVAVRVIVNPHAGLLGAAASARDGRPAAGPRSAE